METVVCNKCQEIKESTCFGIELRSNGATYKRKTCRTCRIQAQDKSKKRISTEKFHSKNILYHVWAGMKRRCDNSDDKKYHRYGGRGITYCDRWGNYKNFEDDMLESYKKGLQLDRIDNDGYYSPENCKWSTPREQSNNRSDNRLVEFKGRSQTLAAWARELNLKKSTVYQRFHSYKWPVEKVLTYHVTQ